MTISTNERAWRLDKRPILNLLKCENIFALTEHRILCVKLKSEFVSGPYFGFNLRFNIINHFSSKVEKNLDVSILSIPPYINQLSIHFSIYFYGIIFPYHVTDDASSGKLKMLVYITKP